MFIKIYMNLKIRGNWEKIKQHRGKLPYFPQLGGISDFFFNIILLYSPLSIIVPSFTEMEFSKN